MKEGFQTYRPPHHHHSGHAQQTPHVGYLANVSALQSFCCLFLSFNLEYWTMAKFLQTRDHVFCLNPGKFPRRNFHGECAWCSPMRRSRLRGFGLRVIPKRQNGDKLSCLPEPGSFSPPHCSFSSWLLSMSVLSFKVSSLSGERDDSLWSPLVSFSAFLRDCSAFTGVQEG